MRNAFKTGINVNPRNVGYISGSSVIHETVRISHQAAFVPVNTANPVGLGTSFSFFVEMEYTSEIKENTLLIHEGAGFKVGPVDELRIQNQVFGKRAPLTVVTPLTANNITSFKIGSAVGMINQTTNTIAITVPAGTNVTAMTPAISHTGKLISKTGAQDFTNPVEYAITAENLATRTYIVTVAVAI